jgi:anti-sigma regulatory factor (Ser/Thr protein kinase)
MSTVHLTFTPDPAYVRTARLVAAAVARRAGVSDDLIDEVRLAIGEACSRAVALHRRYSMTDLIDVTMTDGGRFTIRVVDRGPADSALTEPGQTTLDVMAQVAAESGRVPIDDMAELTVGVGLTLLKALVSDLTVGASGSGRGTEVRMSWPANRRAAA